MNFSEWERFSVCRFVKAAAIIFIIFGATSAGSAIAQSDECSIVPLAFSDPAVLGADQNRIAGLTQLCRAATATRSPDLLPRGTRLAMHAIARALTRSEEKLEKGAALDKELLAVLPSYSRELYNNASSRFQLNALSDSKPNLTAALLRPICIDHPDMDVCYELPKNAELLRRAFLADPKTCKKVTGDRAPDECLRIDDAAVSVAIASDQLLPFVQEYIARANGPTKFCGVGLEEAVCFEALMAVVKYPADLYAKQANLAYALELVEQQKTKSVALLASASAEKFLAAWRTRTPKALADPAVDPNTFFLSANVVRWLGANNLSFEDASRELRSTIDAERLTVAKLAHAYLERIIKLVEANRERMKVLGPPVLAGVDAAISKWHQDSGKLSEDEPAAFIAQVSRLAGPILQLERQLEEQLSQVARNAAAPDAPQCSTAHTIDRSAGVFDACLARADDKAFAAAALRFTFAPCFSAAANCDTAGHIDLLMRTQSSDGMKRMVPVPLGITNLRGTVDAVDGIFRVLRPPAQTYTPHMDQVEQAVAGLLPAPFHVKLASDQIVVDDGPTVTLTVRPSFSLAGLDTLPTLRITVGANGLAIDGDSDTELRAAVLKRIAEALTGRKVSVGGLQITLLQAPQFRVGDCSTKASEPALVLAAEADLLPAFTSRPQLSLEIGCTGSTRLLFPKDSARVLLDEIASKMPSSLGVTLPATEIVMDGERIQFDIKISNACTKSVAIDLSSLKNMSYVLEQITSALKTCVSVAAAKNIGAKALSFAGFDLMSDGDRACTADLPTIGRICLSPASKLAVSPGEIHVEDDGKLASQVRSRLASVFPIVGNIKWASGRLVLPVRVTLPGLEQPIAAEVPLTGNVDLSTMLNASLADAINSNVGDRKARIGPIDVAAVKAAGNADGVVIGGQVSYGGVGARVDIQLLPSFKITAHKPNLNQLIAQLGPIFTGSKSPVDIVTGNDGVPTLIWPVEVTFPLFDTPFKASTVVRGRANGELRLGAVSMTVPGWLVVGSFALGRARIDVDLDHPENIALGALMSVAPGEGTSDLARLQATIHHDAKRSRVDMEGDVALVSVPLARSTGYWNYRKGLLDLQMGPATSLLPLPQGRLVVDGPDCSIIGNSSVTLLGARLADATAGFLMGSACKRGPPAAEDMAAKMSSCGARGSLGALCLIGKAKLGNITEVEGQFASRLDGLHPLVRAQFGLLGDGITVQARLTTVRASLRANVFRILKVTLSFPTLEGMNKETVANLFRNLLKPNIDIEALLKGRFTFNPFNPSGKGEVGSDGTEAGDADGEGTSNDDLADGEKPVISGPLPSTPPSFATGPAPMTPSPPDVRPGSFQGRPGPCQRRAAPDAGLYRVMLTCPGLPEFDLFHMLFRGDDAADLATGRLELDGLAPIELADGRSFRLGCSPWPCRAEGIVAVEVTNKASKRELTKRIKITIPAGGLNPTPGVKTSEVPFPGLTALLAKKQLSGSTIDLSKLKIICAAQSENSCDAAVIDVVDGDGLGAKGSRWSIERGYSAAPIRPETFAHQLLDLKCPLANECDATKLAAALQSWQRIVILASGRVQATGFPSVVMARIFESNAVRDVLIRVGSDGTKGSETPATVHNTWGFEDIYRIQMPRCLSDGAACAMSADSANPLTALLDELASKQTTAIRVDHRGGFAAASTGPDEAATLISTFKTSINGTAAMCSRSVPWAQIRTRLEGNRKKDQPTYGSDAGAELIDRLLNNDPEHALLLRDLVAPPTLSKDGYRRSPLQLFPAPDLSKNCVQLIYHDNKQ